MGDNRGGDAASAAPHFSNGEGREGAERPQPPAQPVVGPDMMFKISKKIAQLTKVIYSLNTRNDDLELELEEIKASVVGDKCETLFDPSMKTLNHAVGLRII